MFSDIFGSISSSVESFSKWVGSGVDTILDYAGAEKDPITKAYKTYGVLGDVATGLGYSTTKAKERQEYSQKYSDVGGNLQPTSQQFDPGATGYGLQQFAGDAAAVENRWKQVLTQFVNPEQVK